MLLTNEDQQTLIRLRELIPQCVRVDIVAGYMSPQGFGCSRRPFVDVLILAAQWISL